MIAKAMQKVEELVRGGIGPQVVHTELGETFYYLNGQRVSSDKEERPDTLHLHTLTALVDLVKVTHDESAASCNSCRSSRWPPHTIVVDSQEHVTLYAPMQDIYSDRPVLAIVEPLSAYRFEFNKFMSVENFIIGLQACFVGNQNRDAVIDAVAGIKQDDSVSLKDDGVCQMATQKRGMQLEKPVQLPNPISLTPFRTFAEVEQPASGFVLRATDKHGEPEVGLWEGDGGAWKNVAATRIKQYLDFELVGTNVSILG